MQLFSIDLTDLDLKIAPEAVQVPFFFKKVKQVVFVKIKMKAVFQDANQLSRPYTVDSGRKLDFRPDTFQLFENKEADCFSTAYHVM